MDTRSRKPEGDCDRVSGPMTQLPALRRLVAAAQADLNEYIGLCYDGELDPEGDAVQVELQAALAAVPVAQIEELVAAASDILKYDMLPDSDDDYAADCERLRAALAGLKEEA